MVDKETHEYSDAELERMLSVDNDWAATEMADRLRRAKDMLMRCSVVLSHMAAERDGFFQRLIRGRWLISDEPLRSDAARLLPDIGNAVRNGKD